MESVLVFSRTKHGADKISRRLERTGIRAAAIHSNRSQSQRDNALQGFKEGKFRVLVATEIAARGIDVTGISHVVNFDIPQEGEAYVHRIGRTGRAGATGAAITFVANEDRQFMRRIEQFTGKRFVVATYPAVIAGEQHYPESKPAANQPSRSDRHVPKKKANASFRSGRKREGLSARRKKPVKPLDTYSTDNGTDAWSNY